jgi:hypothetical protein
MKSNASNSNTQVLVFGLDEAGRPKAGRFSQKEAEAAKEAAISMKFSVGEFASGQAEDLLRQIPPGRIHARGKAFLPAIKKEVYDLLTAEVSKAPAVEEATGSALEQSLARANAEQAAALPTSWDTIAPGHMVLFCELPGDGFYEAIVVKRDNERLTLRFRDFPKHQSVQTHLRSVALVHPGL